ncbi:MAG TPA: hypothetical protein VK636_10680, partial [Gemmatimonadaceae bacterium]|nr:hypothetical protein [Gemmatimonadaceae bacterium]
MLFMSFVFSHRPLVAVLALVASVTALNAQEPIPVRQLAPVDATSRDTVNFLYGVRELSNGGLLANDAGARRLVLFDRSLATSRIVADSASGSPSPYGKRPAGIIPGAADTTLLVDVAARAFVVLDHSGRVSGVMSPPRANDVTSMANPSLGAARLDPKGRLIYRSTLPMAFKPPMPGQPFSMPAMADSAPIIRADFDTRKADTLAWVRVPKLTVTTSSVEGGGEVFRPMFNPLASIDDWAMLPDGSIAILRGRDYHIDWVNADGSRTSSPKMPFDWKRLSDSDKDALLDSTRKTIAKQLATGASGPLPSMAADGHGSGGAAALAGHSLTILRVDAPDGGPAPKSNGAPPPTVSNIELVPPSELPDYVPPVLRSGAMLADPDGNVWILPSTSAQSTGGLLYDVIDRTGRVVQRVRIPEGRALEGFGVGGVVYMTH